MAKTNVMPRTTSAQKALQLTMDLEEVGVTDELLQVLLNNTPVREHVISMLSQYLPSRNRH